MEQTLQRPGPLVAAAPYEERFNDLLGVGHAERYGPAGIRRVLVEGRRIAVDTRAFGPAVARRPRDLTDGLLARP